MLQRQVTFQEAVIRAIKDNYCNFNGRASRSEYWWYCLFAVILGVVISVLFSFSQTAVSVVSGIVNLALLLPSLGLCVRRLHDVGKSGWWIFLAFIPVIGAIVLIIWFCQPRQPQTTAYGPGPNLE